MNKKLLEINHLSIEYVTDKETVYAVNDINLEVNEGETVGMVGETGAGKTTTAYGILQLLPIPPAKIVSGDIIYKGESLLKKSKKEMQKIRGAEISIIFQDPMTALNPIITVGKQIAEVIVNHKHCSEAEAETEVLQILEKVSLLRDLMNILISSPEE